MKKEMLTNAGFLVKLLSSFQHFAFAPVDLPGPGAFHLSGSHFRRFLAGAPGLGQGFTYKV
jgi:hypothetical protein